MRCGSRCTSMPIRRRLAAARPRSSASSTPTCTSTGRRDDAQLTAAVTRPQPAVPFGGQTELLIVGGGLRDVWHAHRDGGQAVQSHRTLLSAMWSVLARSTAAACYLTDR